MPNLDLDPDHFTAAGHPQLIVPFHRAARRESLLAPGRFPVALSSMITSWGRRPQPGGSQFILRFNNGYGAIISEYRQADGIYEVAPLRFHGSGPDDYEFHFRSHVPDLTWCSESEEITRVCEEIARLLPPARV